MADLGNIRRVAALFILIVVLYAGQAKADSVPSSGKATVAKIGDKTVPYSELEPKLLDKLNSMQRQFDAKVHELSLNNARARSALLEAEANQLVDDRVLALAAAANKSTPQALLAEIKPAPVSDGDMQAFYESQSVQIGQPYEAVAAQLRQYLETEASKSAKRKYLLALRDTYKAAVTWEPLREQIDSSGPRRGPEQAPVTIVEFSDFQCPFCGKLTPALQRVLIAYPTQVRLVFRNFPLRSLHPNAAKAAEAGVCAKAQEKFWEMHDVLFAEQNSLSVGALKEKAKRIGLDPERFNKCLDAGEGAAAVAADEAAADNLGLASTPTSFVNGRYVSGAVSYDDLAALVDDELRRISSRTAR